MSLRDRRRVVEDRAEHHQRVVAVVFVVLGIAVGDVHGRVADRRRGRAPFADVVVIVACEEPEHDVHQDVPHGVEPHLILGGEVGQRGLAVEGVRRLHQVFPCPAEVPVPVALFEVAPVADHVVIELDAAPDLAPDRADQGVHTGGDGRHHAFTFARAQAVPKRHDDLDGALEGGIGHARAVRERPVVAIAEIAVVALVEAPRLDPAHQHVDELLLRDRGPAVAERIGAGREDVLLRDGKAVVEPDVDRVDGRELCEHLLALRIIVSRADRPRLVVGPGPVARHPSLILLLVLQEVPGVGLLSRGRAGRRGTGDIVVHAVAHEAHLVRRELGHGVHLVDAVVDAVVAFFRQLHLAVAAALRRGDAVGVDLAAGGGLCFVRAVAVVLDEPLGRQVGDPAAAGVAHDPELDLAGLDLPDQIVLLEVDLHLGDDLVRGAGEALGLPLAAEREVAGPLRLVAHAAHDDGDEGVLFAGVVVVFDGLLADEHADGVRARLDGAVLAEVDVLRGDADLRQRQLDVLGLVGVVQIIALVLLREHAVVQTDVGAAARQHQRHGHRGEMGVVDPRVAVRAVAAVEEVPVRIVEVRGQLLVRVHDGRIAEDAPDHVLTVICFVVFFDITAHRDLFERWRRSGLFALLHEQLARARVVFDVAAAVDIVAVIGEDARVVEPGARVELPVDLVAEHADVDAGVGGGHALDVGVGKSGGIEKQVVRVAVAICRIRAVSLDDDRPVQTEVALRKDRHAGAVISADIACDRGVGEDILVVVDIDAAAAAIRPVALDRAAADGGVLLVEEESAAAHSGPVIRYDEAVDQSGVRAGRALLGIDPAAIAIFGRVGGVAEDRAVAVRRAEDELAVAEVDAAALYGYVVMDGRAAGQLDDRTGPVGVDAAALVLGFVKGDLRAMLHDEGAVRAVQLDPAAVAVGEPGHGRVVARDGDVVQRQHRALFHVDAARAVGAVAAGDQAAGDQLFTILPCSLYVGAGFQRQAGALVQIDDFAVGRGAGGAADTAVDLEAVHVDRGRLAVVQHQTVADVPVLCHRDDLAAFCRVPCIGDDGVPCPAIVDRKDAVELGGKRLRAQRDQQHQHEQQAQAPPSKVFRVHSHHPFSLSRLACAAGAAQWGTLLSFGR